MLFRYYKYSNNMSNRIVGNLGEEIVEEYLIEKIGDRNIKLLNSDEFTDFATFDFLSIQPGALRKVVIEVKNYKNADTYRYFTLGKLCQFVRDAIIEGGIYDETFYNGQNRGGYNIFNNTPSIDYLDEYHNSEFNESNIDMNKLANYKFNRRYAWLKTGGHSIGKRLTTKTINYPQSFYKNTIKLNKERIKVEKYNVIKEEDIKKQYLPKDFRYFVIIVGSFAKYSRTGDVYTFSKIDIDHTLKQYAIIHRNQYNIIYNLIRNKYSYTGNYQPNKDIKTLINKLPESINDKNKDNVSMILKKLVNISTTSDNVDISSILTKVKNEEEQELAFNDIVEILGNKRDKEYKSDNLKRRSFWKKKDKRVRDISSFF